MRRPPGHPKDPSKIQIVVPPEDKAVPQPGVDVRRIEQASPRDVDRHLWLLRNFTPTAKDQLGVRVRL